MMIRKNSWSDVTHAVGPGVTTMMLRVSKAPSRIAASARATHKSATTVHMCAKMPMEWRACTLWPSLRMSRSAISDE